LSNANWVLARELGG